MRILPALLLSASALSAQGPGATWPTATAAEVRLNATVLDSIESEISAGTYGYVDRMVVIRRGQLVRDRSWRHDYAAIYGDSARQASALVMHDRSGSYNYFNPWWHPTYRGGNLHTLQSVTKTVASVVIGVAVTRGDFPSIETPVLSFFDTTKVENIDDRKRKLTIRHLLTMTGGFDWNENLHYADPRNSAVTMEASYDWVGPMISRPMARDPGAAFNYSSGESILLAHIFRMATGQDIEQYAAAHLFQPIGITEWFWKRTPAGVVDTEGGLYLDALDLARIWQLFGQQGKWQGTQVVSADWVAQSTTPQISLSPNPAAAKYGFKWWLYPNPTDPAKLIWAGSGFGGQLPYYFPELDLLVVFNGWNILPGGPPFPQRRIMERLAKAAISES